MQIGAIMRLYSVPENELTASRPKSLRKICLLDNKHHPDFYIAGLMAGFLGLQRLCRWYHVLRRPEGAGAFLKGLLDIESGKYVFADLVGDLWRVRRTDENVFDAALYYKYGDSEAERMIAEIEGCGEAALEELEKAQAQEMDLMALGELCGMVDEVVI